MSHCPTVRRLFAHFVLCSLALPGIFGALPVQAEPPARHTIAPGVVLIQEIVPDGSPDGPLAIILIDVDLKEKGVQVSAALGQDRVWGTDPTLGREIVSTLSARHQATAAINAGFFPFQGNPIGLHIQAGEMVTEPTANRSCLLIQQDHTAKIAAFSYSGFIAVNDREDAPRYKLDGMNRQPAKKEEMILYTPIFFSKTLKTPVRTEVILSGIKGPLHPNQTYRGKVEAIRSTGETPLSPDTVVLSAIGGGADFLKQYAVPGDSLSFQLSVTPLNGAEVDFKTVQEAVAGGPRLLTDGKVTITNTAEGMGNAFVTDRHPRTAVGITRDGHLLLVVVDGRQKGVSRGMSLPELANLFLKYDVQNAVNLDGGGSSTAIVRDLIVNSPSGGKERAIANALLVSAPPLKKKPKESSSSVALPTPPASLLPGDRFVFSTKPSSVKGVWGVTGGIGFISQTGVFTAVLPGTGTISFLPDESRVPVSVSVVVAAPVKPLPPQPKPEPGEPDE